MGNQLLARLIRITPEFPVFDNILLNANGILDKTWFELNFFQICWYSRSIPECLPDVQFSFYCIYHIWNGFKPHTHDPLANDNECSVSKCFDHLTILVRFWVQFTAFALYLRAKSTPFWGREWSVKAVVARSLSRNSRLNSNHHCDLIHFEIRLLLL